ncbi:hypothetical protein CC80DRAFT_401842 [Byssothecium circinans]|uniref:Uncharacterized protein n=1 Tax=Byssothecium circinans TaxID=147558 RepID=A0A6A5UFA2_9PLEO|nr:hypothetical protein CC80DRAFT_401842 [Byssothecium circinans]
MFPPRNATQVTNPVRVCIRICVTDVPGDPLDRTATLGRVFCSKILDRPFQPLPGLLGYDHGHIPPSFDSSNPVSAWFIYDLNVTSELGKEQLNDIPHYVFLASQQRTGELEFIPREMWIEKARERAKIYTWGGRQEQDELREMRNSCQRA